MSRVCEKCGMIIPAGRLCQTCAKYKRNGGIWHPLPAFGTVAYDEDGKPICHVCGMAMDKLIEHTKRKHGLDTEAYRSKFGLMRKNARLTSPKYADKMRLYAQEYETHKINFADVQNGLAPRGRRNPKWSPQEIESRRKQQAAKGRLSKSKLTPERRKELAEIWRRNLPHATERMNKEVLS